MYDLPALNEHVRVTISAAVVRGKGKAKITPSYKREMQPSKLSLGKY